MWIAWTVWVWCSYIEQPMLSSPQTPCSLFVKLFPPLLLGNIGCLHNGHVLSEFVRGLINQQVWTGSVLHYLGLLFDVWKCVLQEHSIRLEFSFLFKVSLDDWITSVYIFVNNKLQMALCCWQSTDYNLIIQLVQSWGDLGPICWHFQKHSLLHVTNSNYLLFMTGAQSTMVLWATSKCSLAHNWYLAVWLDLQSFVAFNKTNRLACFNSLHIYT